MPPIVQVPSAAAVVVTEPVWLTPSLTIKATVANGVAVPLAEVLLKFVELMIAGVMVVNVRVGATVSLFAVFVAWAVAPEIVAVAMNVIVPSLTLLASKLLIDQLPDASTVVVCAGVVWTPSVATSEIVAPDSPVPLAETEC